MADLMEQADEVQEALGRTYNTPEIDEDELAAELDALGDEILDDDQNYLDDVLKAPEAPSTKPEAEKDKNKVKNESCHRFYVLTCILRFLGWNTS